MEHLDLILAGLPEQHRVALQWFHTHAGEDSAWPGDLIEGMLLASKAKGIYKPAWMPYALSVRQSINDPYPDREPKVRPDGTWSYLYFQENRDPNARDSEYTNRGMMECWKDRMPVGVLLQVCERPRSRYRVLGVALVAGWNEGYFLLEGFSPDGLSCGCNPR